jgi:hypothetical protein
MLGHRAPAQPPLIGAPDAGWNAETPIEAQAFNAARTMPPFPPRRPTGTDRPSAEQIRSTFVEPTTYAAE